MLRNNHFGLKNIFISKNENKKVMKILPPFINFIFWFAYMTSDNFLSISCKKYIIFYNTLIRIKVATRQTINLIMLSGLKIKYFFLQNLTPFYILNFFYV